MLNLQNLLTVTAVLAACIGLRALLHKCLRCCAVMWVWYTAALWLCVNALPGALPFVGSLWALPLTDTQPALPPLVISSVKHGVSAISSTAWLYIPDLLWVAGAVAVAVWLVRDRLKEYKKCTVLLRCADQLQPVLPLPARVQLLQSELVAGPMTVDGLHPVILVPLEYTQLSAEQQTMVLVHELTHIKKRDTLFKLLLVVLTVLYWYHPLIWVLRSMVLCDMEYRCDEAVLDRCGAAHKRTYGEMLQQFAVGDIMGAGMVHAMSAGRQLELRLRYMLRYRRPTLLHSAAALLLTLVLTALLGTAAPLQAGAAAAYTDRVALQARPLLAGWTGSHALTGQQAIVYTNAGGVWRLEKDEAVQMTLVSADSGLHDVVMGYLDVGQQKYVIVHTGSFENHVRVHWEAPYDGEYCFFLLSGDDLGAPIQSFTIFSR